MNPLETIEKLISLKDPDEKDESLSLIYRIAHSTNKSHSCYSVHENWRIEAEQVAKELKYL